MNYNQSGFKIEGKRLVLSKIGAINIKLHRPLEGRVKGVIVKRAIPLAGGTPSSRLNLNLKLDMRPCLKRAEPWASTWG